MQMLSDEPEIEYQALHHSYVGLRSENIDQKLFVAWAKGYTGYPIIDASMRALKKYGWLPFRLRALLISFASYHLWLHWRDPAIYLARLSTDYEPGIHYSQVQMQAGTSGIRQWRIFNPVAQSRKLDADGEFIKSECPELAELSSHYIHTPWTMPHGEQVMVSCIIGQDYPQPIVDYHKENDLALEKLKSHLLEYYDPEETDRVMKKHASRPLLKKHEETLAKEEEHIGTNMRLIPYDDEDA